MAQLELYFLGAPLIKLDGAAVDTARRKALALLAYLAVTGESHRRESLATLLWPDYDTAASFAYLRRALWELNGALGEGWVEAGRDTVRLAERPEMWMDVAQFRARLERAACHSDRLAPACQQELSAAAGLYRGDFLAGFSLPDSPAFDDWQFFQAEELRRSLAGALESLALGSANRGEFDSAVTYARRWLGLDPLHEPAHRLLMQIYAWMGQRSAALRQYEACVQALQSELGLPPQLETTTLYERIRSGRSDTPPPGGRLRSWRDNSPVAGPAWRPPEGAGLPGAGPLPPPAAPGEERQAAGPAAAESLLAASPLLNFPATLTPFVGRRKELDEIARLLAEPTNRLVTLLGPGGIGKTRLAIQAALELAGFLGPSGPGDGTPAGAFGAGPAGVGAGAGAEAVAEAVAGSTPLYPDGVVFVSLASLSEPENIVPAIARALGFAFYDEGPEPRLQLIDFLRGKRLLLVLDNYEHLIDEASARLPVEILGAALGVGILVTSRASLNVQGEQLYPVGGMSVPAGVPNDGAAPEEMAAFSAVALFNQSARRVQPAFRLDAESLPQVVRICQLVEGMPLGIELAAAWLDLLSLEGIAAEIRRNLDFLETHLRDVPERQRSLRAVFDASWKLLTPQEQEVFRKLSVFAGGFSRNAAQAVVGASLHDLSGLVSKSLLQREGSDRYAVHELLRQYAAEKLQGDLEAWDAVRDGHSDYYARFLYKQGEAMKGPGQKEAMRAVGVELDNIRAAAGWALVNRRWGRLERSLYGLVTYLMAQSLYYEGEAFLDDAIATVDEPQAGREDRLFLAKLLALHAYVSYDLVSSRPSQNIQRSLAIVEELGAEEELGIFYSILSAGYGYRIDPQEGIRRLRRSVENLRAAGRPWDLAFSLQSLGDLLMIVGERADARQALLEAADISQRLGDRQGFANANSLLAHLEASQGNYAAALRLHAELKEIYLDLGNLSDSIYTQYELGQISMATGAYREAVAYFQGALRPMADRGARPYEASMLSWMSIATVRLGDYAAARQMREESLRLSLATGDKTGIVWSYWELGDIERLEGNYAQALQDYQESLRLFEENKIFNLYTFYHRGLGDLARAQGDQARNAGDEPGARTAYAEARRQYEKSLALSREEYHFWNTAYALAGLAYVDLAEGDLETARQHLAEAVEIAGRVGDQGMILITLAAAAALFAAEGDAGRAVELAAVILAQPATWRDTRTQVAALLETLTPGLPAEASAAAQARGEAAALEAVVREARDHLGARGN